MSLTAPRVAYFPDSYHEINGVAHTSRQFEAFARRRGWPFLCVRAGKRGPELVKDGPVWTLELPRSVLAFPIEKDLSFDPLFSRYRRRIRAALEEFGAELIHITGPSEVGLTGAWLARRMGLPLAASWHTNVHEYLTRRSGWLLRLLPRERAAALGKKLEGLALSASAKLYTLAGVLYAPNRELCALLEGATGKPCYLMPRGVDAELFHPDRRTRASGDGELVLGFVGRLSVEKNVALLARVQPELERGLGTGFHFVIIGHGAEQENLRRSLPRAEFTGVLRGERLARAYADMDVFVFPSHTDTFGNVVLEALASGVPAVVTPDGGPASIVRDGETGRVAPDEGFTEAIAGIVRDRERYAAMRTAARAYAVKESWDSVFEGVYAHYGELFPSSGPATAAGQGTAERDAEPAASS